jgi:acetate kinase
MASVAKAAIFIVDWLKQQINDYKIAGIGHRVVQGGLQFS